jgi:hypothetical protein
VAISSLSCLRLYGGRRSKDAPSDRVSRHFDDAERVSEAFATWEAGASPRHVERVSEAFSTWEEGDGVPFGYPYP